MKPTLQLKLSQHLTLTPQLQQSIRLLQLSTLELNAEVERLLQENPLLEKADDDEGAVAAGRVRANRRSPSANGESAAEPDRCAAAMTDFDVMASVGGDNDWGARRPAPATTTRSFFAAAGRD